MILYVNVFITDDKLSKHFHFDHGLLPIDNPLDVFKYTVASYGAFKPILSKVVINCKLDSNYAPQADALLGFIHETFGDTPLYCKIGYRNERQIDWRNDLDKHGIDGKGEPVFFTANHDHPFMAPDISLIEQAVSLIKREQRHASMYFSHWPELLQIAQKQIGATQNGNFVEFAWQSNDSIQLLSQSILRSMWFDHDYGDAFLPRPDFHAQAIAPPAKFFVPLREQCRHYDGYGHVGISKNDCPPLRIPPGFFDRSIKIRYGHEINKDGCVNIHPMKFNYTTVDPNGTDYKWTLDDIPAFWRGRIAEIDANSDTVENHA